MTMVIYYTFATAEIDAQDDDWIVTSRMTSDESEDVASQHVITQRNDDVGPLNRMLERRRPNVSPIQVRYDGRP